MIAKPAMTRDADAKGARLFDRRTVERNIKKGLITRKDYDKYLKALSDVADKGTHGAEETPAASQTPAGEAAPGPGEPPPTNSHN